MIRAESGHDKQGQVDLVLPKFRQAWRSARMSTSLSLLEVLVVTFTLMAIQVVVFHGYYLGSTSPGGDFLGLYSNEPFAWWRDGGILNPPAWMPYLWGGYPSVASIQNSSWYLPTGVAALFGFDIHASASLQAFHVAIAGLGVYVLGRRARFGRVASIFGMVAYSFTTGFFSNAPYVDIVRGHALAPWILLCLSPLWPWKRAWAVPVAAVIFWQAAVGVYPGMLVAFAYAGTAWAIAWQLALRPSLRRFALPLFASVAIAVLLSMPKYLPLVELRTFQSGGALDLSVLTRSSLGSLLLPAYANLPGVYSLNTFFIPAGALLIAVFASFRDVAVRAAAAAATFTLVLVVPQFPGRELVNLLPGMEVSRFRLNDFTPFIILPVIIAGMSGLVWLRQLGGRPIRGRSLWVRLAAVLLAPLAAIAFIVFGKFSEADWRPTVAVLMLTTVCVVGIAALASRGQLKRFLRILAPVVVICLTAASGLAYTRTVVGLWSIDSIAAQKSLWGASSTDLMEHRIDIAGATQRPARSEVPPNASASELISAAHNGALYSGQPSVGGYLNVHMSASFVMARQALSDPGTADAERAMLIAPGIVIGWNGGLPQAGAVQRCVATRDCNGVTTEPVSYTPGNLVYRVTAASPTAVLANEAYYVGWSVLAVDQSGRATVLEPSLGPGGVISFDLPAGVWLVSLVYRTPMGSASNALAGIGIALTAASVVWRVLSARGRRAALQRAQP